MFYNSMGVSLSRKCNPMGGCHFLGGCPSLKCYPVGVSGLYQQVQDWVG